MTAGYFRKTTDRVSFAAEMMERHSDIIESAKRILVKPNIVSSEPYPTTTHPDLLDEVLKRLDGRDILVADGAAVDIMRTNRVIVEHKLHHMAEKHGVKVVDLHQTPSGSFKSPRGFALNLSRTPFNFDLIISLPVLKSHKICVMTGALKNQFGFTTKTDRIKMHTGIKDIHKSIAEINALRKPGLVIMDAVETLTYTNEARHGGKRATLGFMLGGTDPVALDAKGLELLSSVDEALWGRRAPDVRYIKHAADYGIGDINGEIIEI